MRPSLLHLLLFLTFLSRQPKDLNTISLNISIAKRNSAIFKSNDRKTDTLRVICDTVYKSKGYRITLIKFDRDNDDETKFNSVFILEKLIHGKYQKVFSDSIYNSTLAVRFDDFNNDKVKDILVQHYSDVRSNWSYYLYLVDIKKDKLKKIKGFEEIKNPNYLPQYNLIDNYVMSGQIWTSFYKIKNGRIKDFNIEIYDDQSENGTYERDCKKAIKKILASEKNNR